MLLYIAITTNLVDLIESLLLNIRDITKINRDGDIVFYLIVQSSYLIVSKIL